MRSIIRLTIHQQLRISVFILVCVFVSVKSFGQLGISGSTTVNMGTSYTYNGTYNGFSSYSYSGSYTYTITGGVVTGTSNTVKTGTATMVIGSATVNVTWTSSSGTLNLNCGLGSKTINITAIAALDPGTLSPSSQTINYGASSATLTGTAATGGPQVRCIPTSG